MRHVLGVLLVAGFCACSGAPPMVGAAASSVEVAGSVPRPRSFDRAALELLGTVEVRWEHDGATKTYLGVALSRLLSECGHEAGPGGRALTPRERRGPAGARSWRRKLPTGIKRSSQRPRLTLMRGRPAPTSCGWKTGSHCPPRTVRFDSSRLPTSAASGRCVSSPPSVSSLLAGRPDDCPTSRLVDSAQSWSS